MAPHCSDGVGESTGPDRGQSQRASSVGSGPSGGWGGGGRSHPLLCTCWAGGPGKPGNGMLSMLVGLHKEILRVAALTTFGVPLYENRETPVLPPCSGARGGVLGVQTASDPARRWTRVGVYLLGAPPSRRPHPRPNPPPHASQGRTSERSLRRLGTSRPTPVPAAPESSGPRATSERRGLGRCGWGERDRKWGRAPECVSSLDGRSRAITRARDGSSTGNLEEEPAAGRRGGTAAPRNRTESLGGRAAGEPAQAACGARAPAPLPSSQVSLSLLRKAVV